MSTIKEADKLFSNFADGFENIIESTIKDNKLEIVDFIQEQLYSGINGNDKPLRPDYLTDPYLKTKESGRWRNNGKGYAMWKKRITKPLPSYLNIPPRDVFTPNLIISGEFYNSITATPIGEGVKIATRGVSFGSDIEKKYGSEIFGLGMNAKKYFIKYTLNPELKKHFSKFGL